MVKTYIDKIMIETFTNKAKVSAMTENDMKYRFLVSGLRRELNSVTYEYKYIPYSIIWVTTTPTMTEDDFNKVTALFDGLVMFTYVQLLQEEKQANLI